MKGAPADTTEKELVWLLRAGYRVGLYQKPELVHFNERCRVGGRPVAGDALVPHFEAVEQARAAITLTKFEFTTLAIAHLLAQEPLDLVILEPLVHIDDLDLLGFCLLLLHRAARAVHIDLLGPGGRTEPAGKYLDVTVLAKTCAYVLREVRNGLEYRDAAAVTRVEIARPLTFVTA